MNHPDNLTVIRDHRAEVDSAYAEARRLSGKVVIGGTGKLWRTSRTGDHRSPLRITRYAFSASGGGKNGATLRTPSS